MSQVVTDQTSEPTRPRPIAADPTTADGPVPTEDLAAPSNDDPRSSLTRRRHALTVAGFALALACLAGLTHTAALDVAAPAGTAGVGNILANR